MSNSISWLRQRRTSTGNRKAVTPFPPAPSLNSDSDSPCHCNSLSLSSPHPAARRKMPNAATFAARSHKQAPPFLPPVPAPARCLAVKELRQWRGGAERSFGFLISHYAGWKILVRLLVASSVFKMKNEATAACGTHQRHICVSVCVCVHCWEFKPFTWHNPLAPPPSFSICLPACCVARGLLN